MRVVPPFLSVRRSGARGDESGIAAANRSRRAVGVREWPKGKRMRYESEKLDKGPRRMP